MVGSREAGKVVALSGTPGTGKSLVGRRVSEALGMELVELSDLVIGNRLYAGYDEVRRTFVVDEDRLRDYLRRLVAERGRVLVVGHYSEIVDDSMLDKIVVLRLNPAELYERLTERGWPPDKVVENVEAELLGVCTGNALSEHPPEKVCEVDVSGKSVEEASREVVDVIVGSRPCKTYVDWLSDESLVSFVLGLGGAPGYPMRSDGEALS